MSRLCLAVAGLFLIALVACCRSGPTDDAPHAWLAPAASGPGDAPLAGTWAGRARLLAAAGTPDSVPLELAFDGHGGVSGLLGDVRLTRGLVKDNRADLLQDSGWTGTWLVEAELAGELGADGGPHRTSVVIPFDVIEGILTGGLYASPSPEADDALTYVLEGVVRASG